MLKIGQSWGKIANYPLQSSTKIGTPAIKHVLASKCPVNLNRYWHCKSMEVQTSCASLLHSTKVSGLRVLTRGGVRTQGSRPRTAFPRTDFFEAKDTGASVLGKKIFFRRSPKKKVFKNFFACARVTYVAGVFVFKLMPIMGVGAQNDLGGHQSFTRKMT